VAWRCGWRTRAGIPATFFTWQNLDRRYPFPFSAFERANYRTVRVAIAGNQDAAAVLRRKGLHRRNRRDPAVWRRSGNLCAGCARAMPAAADQPLRIGYAGGLLPEKGLADLLHACAALRGAWR
jgi:hypothetical protein